VVKNFAFILISKDKVFYHTTTSFEQLSYDNVGGCFLGIKSTLNLIKALFERQGKNRYGGKNIRGKNKHGGVKT
jgi:hypothetical protein